MDKHVSCHLAFLPGLVGVSSPESNAVRLTGLRRGLNESGYVEGRNFVQTHVAVGCAPLASHPLLDATATQLASHVAANRNSFQGAGCITSEIALVTASPARPSTTAAQPTIMARGCAWVH